jgi:CDP-paratose 2-epimerase
MGVAIVTGSAGLIGSEASLHFGRLGIEVIGIDNDMRSIFFGPEASTRWNVSTLQQELGRSYRHLDVDIRERQAISDLFQRYGPAVDLVIHTAAQPSHDWAARNPYVDFEVNAGGTINLLEATRQHAPEAVFIFTSTNKVYGDTPNRLPLVELESRFEIDPSHRYRNGISEDMRVDRSLHSLFGASKLAADVLVQEYGRYFELQTVCFRGGTLTGQLHAATELHGFLAYVMRCIMTRSPYTVQGYKGKQVRDAIHSSDLVRAFEAFFRDPRPAEVYNIGGGRFSNASVVEAIERGQRIAGEELAWSYRDHPRVGDHVWWISDNGRFQSHYPEWTLEYDIDRILKEIYEANLDRWSP